MNGSKKELLSYFENMSLFMVGLLFVLFPLFFLDTTTDAFVLPKQFALIGLTTLAVLFLGLRTIAEGKLRLRTSPFDLPVVLFLIVGFLSAFLSANRYDALTAFVPFFFVGLLYFVVINVAKSERQLLFMLTSLTLGAALAALLATTLYVLTSTHHSLHTLFPAVPAYMDAVGFTTFGALLDQALYFALVLPIAGYFGYSLINKPKHEGVVQKKSRGLMVGFGIGFVIIAIGLALSVFVLMTSQKPFILPYSVGLQTAFAAISQNSANVFKSLLLGSGFGTYLNDFTQFKPASFNANATLWAFTFFRSSSFALELLATTGLLGIATFGLLLYKIFKQKSFFLPVILAVAAAILLPFSFTLLALFFILLALFAVVCIHNNPSKFGESEMHLVALRRGLLAISPEHERTAQNGSERKLSKVLPIIFTLAIIALLSYPLYLVYRYGASDFVFQRSLVAAAQNNGIETYKLQAESITIFPYRDIYYRSFSQTNIALANALATNQPKGASPSAQTQKNILTLIQQSISAGRTAVTVSPTTSFNWNNLSSIYRSLIGFGQNADKFTILTLNQAIALDPNNPQQYIDLGGVYYQLGQFDEAIRQFQVAINQKQDYANAYYNVGHALEEKGDYNNAMAAYQTVKTLVAGNDVNTKKINADIDNLNKKAGKAQAAQKAQQANPSTSPAPSQAPIDVNKPGTVLPSRNPKEQIPGPTVGAPVASPTTAAGKEIVPTP